MEFPVIACAFLMLTALFTDIAWRKIPNLLTIPTVLAGFLFHGLYIGETAFAVAGMLAGCGLLFIPFLMGGSGGGDVKLLGAAGAWLGAKAVFSIFVYGAIIGGIISCTILFRRGGFNGLKAVWHDLFCLLLTRQIRPSESNGKGIPYSVPVAAGFCLFLAIGNI